jgi:hypothetical protein
MTRITFARLSDAPPPMREMLEIEDDGSWRAWRSVGQAIGRFADRGGADAAGRRIVELAAATEEADPPAASEFHPDATVDTIRVGERSVAVSYRASRTGPWGELLSATRGLLDDAISHPTAAIGLVLVANDRVRLEHRGTDPLPIELGSAQVEATVWQHGVFVGAGTGRVEAGHVDTGPGWSLDVALDGIDPAANGEAVVFVSFVADDGGVYIPVTLSAGRAPA